METADVNTRVKAGDSPIVAPGLPAESNAEHLIGYAVLALIAVLVILGIIALGSPRYRKRVLRAAAWSAGGLVGAYAVLRVLTSSSRSITPTRRATAATGEVPPWQGCSSCTATLASRS